jgi:hypothetical protein
MFNAIIWILIHLAVVILLITASKHRNWIFYAALLTNAAALGSRIPNLFQ